MYTSQCCISLKMRLAIDKVIIRQEKGPKKKTIYTIAQTVESIQMRHGKTAVIRKIDETNTKTEKPMHRGRKEVLYVLPL